MRAEAFARAHGRLVEVLAIAPPLVLGVVRDGLIHGQTKIESGSAQRLAEALRSNHVAMVAIEEDVRPAELERFLRLLGADRGQGEAAPIWDRLAAAGVRGIALEPVDYHAVVMTDDAAPEGYESVSIWETITRELLGGRSLAPLAREEELPAPGSAEEVARWIENLLRETESRGSVRAGAESGPAAEGAPGNPGGEVAVGPPPAGGQRAVDRAGGDRGAAIAAALGEAVTSHLGRLRGPARQSATQQIVDVANRLPVGMRPVLLQASLRALAAEDDAAEALRTLTAGQPPSAVLGALRQLAAERVQLSTSALRLARELHAIVREQRERATPVDPEVYRAMRELFRDVDIDRVAQPGPGADDRRGILEVPVVHLESGEVPDLGARRDTLADDFVAHQLARTLLELVGSSVPGRAPDEATLWRLEDLYRSFLLAGRLLQAAEVVEELRALLKQARDAGGPDAELRRCIERLANREAVAALLHDLLELPADAAQPVHRLIELLGPVAVRHLVAALSEESDRSRRHALLDLLSSLGPAVIPHATLLLGDPRWFVVRNMIVLLRTVGDQTSVPQVRRCAEHPDLRVRLEAIKSLFSFDTQVPTELLAKAIDDPNPKVAEAAVALVGTYRITQGVAPLVALLRRWDLFGRRRVVRLRALKVLGRLGDPTALPRLERFFRDRVVRLVAREERVAAYAALAGYREEVRRPIVERGARSRDPDVRAACARLQAGGAQSLDETHV